MTILIVALTYNAELCMIFVYSNQRTKDVQDYTQYRRRV